VSGAFEHYDQEIAAAMLRSDRYSDGAAGGGLPAYLKIETTSVAPGRLTCELPVTAELLNPFGAAHGGVVSALIDHALGAVCLPVVVPGSWPATQEFKLSFVAPARPGLMTADANIVSMSKRTAIVRVDVSNNGRLVCAAQGTVAIMPPRPTADGQPPPGTLYPRT
jgi:1,4-dihydroxy-2-naphthoyl-CoA hydrolase